MAMNFPDSPTIGQIFTDASGAQYKWDGVAWGQVSPVNASLGSPFRRSSYTSSTNAFQYHASTLYADIEVCGGGAGGGTSGGGSGAGLGGAGSGGGGGGYGKRLIQITDPIRAATKTITIGAGGGQGADGGDTTYADGTWTLVGTGGTKGLNGVPNATIITRFGGAGGASTGMQIGVNGCFGSNSISFGSTQCGAGASAGYGGAGGASGMGGGGGVAGNLTSSTTPTNSSGGNGFGTGGGGAGGVGINAVGSAATGGSGVSGIVIITEYR